MTAVIPSLRRCRAGRAGGVATMLPEDVSGCVVLSEEELGLRIQMLEEKQMRAMPALSPSRSRTW